MGEFPSGQRGQTVNLLAMPSMVRIHLPPPKMPITLFGVIGIFLCAEDGVEVYPRQGKSIFPHQKYRLSFWTVGIFLFREDAQTLGKCTELRSPPSTPRRKTAHDPPAHTMGGVLLLRPPHAPGALRRAASSRRDRPPTSVSKQSAHTVSPPCAHGPRYASSHAGSGAKHTSHRRIRIPPFRLQNYYAFG